MVARSLIQADPEHGAAIYEETVSALMGTLKIYLQEECATSSSLNSFCTAEDGFNQTGVHKDGHESQEKFEWHPRSDLSWDDCIGCGEAKKSLQQAVVWPLKYSWFFNSPIRRPYSGILLYGNPGVGKTILVEIAASLSSAKLYKVKGSDLKSEWFGKSEGMVKSLFQDARRHGMSIIFIDEIDGLCSERSERGYQAGEGIVTELLQEINLSSSKSQVIVIGATNFPQKLDKAILRRLEKRIYVKLPNKTDRERLLRYFTRDIPNTLTDKELKMLAEKTEVSS